MTSTFYFCLLWVLGLKACTTMPVSDYHFLMRYSLTVCGCIEVWIFVSTVWNVICHMSKYITISLKKALQKVPSASSVLLCLFGITKYHQVMLCYICLDDIMVYSHWYWTPGYILKNVGFVVTTLSHSNMLAMFLQTCKMNTWHTYIHIYIPTHVYTSMKRHTQMLTK